MPLSSEINNAPLLSRMTEQDTLNLFTESLKEASSLAVQMGRAQENPIWIDVAKLLYEMCVNGNRLADSRGLSRTEALKILDDRQKILGIKTQE